MILSRHVLEQIFCFGIGWERDEIKQKTLTLTVSTQS